MTRSWTALPEAALSDLRLATAGPAAFPIFARLLVDAEDSGGGVAPAHRAEPRQLAVALAAFAITADDVRRALACWAGAGVIRLAADGSVDLREYLADASRAQTSAERGRAHRARQKVAAVAAVTETNDEVRHANDAVSHSNGAACAGNGAVAYLPTDRPTNPPAPPAASGGRAGAETDDDFGLTRARAIRAALRGEGPGDG